MTTMMLKCVTFFFFFFALVGCSGFMFQNKSDCEVVVSAARLNMEEVWAVSVKAEKVLDKAKVLCKAHTSYLAAGDDEQRLISFKEAEVAFTKEWGLTHKNPCAELVYFEALVAEAFSVFEEAKEAYVKAEYLRLKDSYLKFAESEAKIEAEFKAKLKASIEALAKAKAKAKAKPKP